MKTNSYTNLCNLNQAQNLTITIAKIILKWKEIYRWNLNLKIQIRMLKSTFLCLHNLRLLCLLLRCWRLSEKQPKNYWLLRLFHFEGKSRNFATLIFKQKQDKGCKNQVQVNFKSLSWCNLRSRISVLERKRQQRTQRIQYTKLSHIRRQKEANKLIMCIQNKNDHPALFLLYFYNKFQLFIMCLLNQTRYILITNNISPKAQAMTSQTETAEDFLKIAPQFKLGCLLTQKQNPRTIGLSTLAKNNLNEAINKIKDLDITTMQILYGKINQLENMYRDVNQCLESGGRVFICGCGATGRLSLVLETLWRQETKEIYQDWSERVVAFMAGGDSALIKSVEDFQDHPEFAQQQLVELGFKDNDILIGSTEGGQTPWVIGAVWKSTEISHRKPYILYGNTDQILIANVERSKQFILSDKINKINCNVGEMALAGSTRMQSTTILMHGIGVALLGCDRLRKIRYPNHQTWLSYAQTNIKTFLTYIKSTDFSLLSKLIQQQTQIYKKGQQITYITDPYYAISILTDTTQRSPTFSLLPFKNKYYDPVQHRCWCNLKIINQDVEKEEDWDKKVEGNWRVLLGGRNIRGLNSQYWERYKHKVSHQTILGFGLHQAYENTLLISHPLCFTSKTSKISFPQYPLPCRLSHHSLLKILLNNLSTLIMGRMSRYENNIMTYVKPTNYKLIDRSTRYVMMLRPQSKYDEVVRIIYEIRKKIRPDEPIVLKVIEVLESREKDKQKKEEVGGTKQEIREVQGKVEEKRENKD